MARPKDVPDYSGFLTRRDVLEIAANAAKATFPFAGGLGLGASIVRRVAPLVDLGLCRLETGQPQQSDVRVQLNGEEVDFSYTNMLATNPEIKSASEIATHIPSLERFFSNHSGLRVSGMSVDILYGFNVPQDFCVEQDSVLSERFLRKFGERDERLVVRRVPTDAFLIPTITDWQTDSFNFEPYIPQSDEGSFRYFHFTATPRVGLEPFALLTHGSLGEYGYSPSDGSVYTFRGNVEVVDPLLRAQGWQDGEYSFVGEENYFSPDLYNAYGDLSGNPTRLAVLEPQSGRLRYSDFLVQPLAHVAPHTK